MCRHNIEEKKIIGINTTDFLVYNEFKTKCSICGETLQTKIYYKQENQDFVHGLYITHNPEEVFTYLKDEYLRANYATLINLSLDSVIEDKTKLLMNYFYYGEKKSATPQEELLYQIIDIISSEKFSDDEIENVCTNMTWLHYLSISNPDDIEETYLNLDDQEQFNVGIKVALISKTMFFLAMNYIVQNNVRFCYGNSN